MPVGTVLTVNLGEALGSKISQPGQTFSATLAQPVTVGGETVLAKGATASGTVVDAKPLGRFKGGAVLQLKLNSISDLPVETSSVVRTATGKGKRTATMVGGGAGLGPSSEVWQAAVKAQRSAHLPALAQELRELPTPEIKILPCRRKLPSASNWSSRWRSKNN